MVMKMEWTVEIEDDLVADFLGINHLTPEEIEEILRDKYDEMDAVIQSACDQALEIFFDEVRK
jgi:low affinity Fe/Cu permease